MSIELRKVAITEADFRVSVTPTVGIYYTDFLLMKLQLSTDIYR